LLCPYPDLTFFKYSILSKPKNATTFHSQHIGDWSNGENQSFIKIEHLFKEEAWELCMRKDFTNDPTSLDRNIKFISR